jgi:glycosyltransferase involved in cell wall biosynthesis
MRISIIVISKDEEKLSDTLSALEVHIDTKDINIDHEVDITVVDASRGRLAHIKQSFPNVQWVDFTPPPAIRVSIPHQRNCGIRATKGEIIVFTDAGCIPEEKWLVRLLAPLVSGSERMTCGPSWVGDNVYSPERGAPVPRYVDEAATINLAFTRELVDEVGEFDEAFEYGSDIDFTRRVVASGTPIRYVADAVVDHDWGTFRRQLKRSRQYGAARIRLSRKYSDGVLTMARDEPVGVLYALFIVGLPLTLRLRSYLLLLAIPLWRARKRPYPLRVVASHLAEGIGSLNEFADMALKSLSGSS